MLAEGAITTQSQNVQLDPRALKTFLAVCREGSITAAARQLNVAQPSVSVAMSQLERSLDATLFERGRTGVTLTRAGLALRRRAEAMEMLLEAAQREIELLDLDVAGPLTIGGTPGALASILPNVIARIRSVFPRFELRVLERTDAALLDLLRSERIDLAIVTTGIDTVPEDVVEETLLRDPFDLIVGEANAHLPEHLRLTELGEASWVLPDAVGGFRRQIDALFVAAQMTIPSNVIRCDSLLSTKAIVRQTDYVTILPREVAVAELSVGALRAIRIDEVDFTRNVGIRTLKGRPSSPIIEAFLNAARDREAAVLAPGTTQLDLLAR
jgi:LysR family transcriptional regulator of abg operon